MTLTLLGSSFGVAESASAAAPEHLAAGHAQVTNIRHHLGHIEAESGEVRHPLETLTLATARPLEPRRTAAGGSPSGGSR